MIELEGQATHRRTCELAPVFKLKFGLLTLFSRWVIMTLNLESESEIGGDSYPPR